MSEQDPTGPRPRARIVIVTGLSGSGKTTALHALEDIGFTCMDNLPVALLPKVAELAAHGENARRVAIVIDVRDPHLARDLNPVLSELQRDGVSFESLFLDAQDATLLQRFKATRRRHPLGEGHGLERAIETERRQLEALRVQADRVIFTDDLNVHQLKERIQDHYGSEHRPLMQSRLVSFGFKHGPMLDADVTFDVRFLPNPHFVPELKHATGLERAVAHFVLDHETTSEFVDLTTALLRFALPHYAAEGKAYLTVAFGCTGGQHRSVCLAEHFAQSLKDLGLPIAVEHRDRAHWNLEPDR